MMQLFYICYLLSLFVFGLVLGIHLFPTYKKNLFFLSISSLVGIAGGVAITYFIALLAQLVFIPPIMTAIIGFLSLVIYLAYKFRREIHAACLPIYPDYFDAGAIIFSVFMSAYIMVKTFKYVDATLFIARNTIFDFAHLLSIVRSMSWGENIPYHSPFVAGTEHIYHFFFAWLSAIGEWSGLPIDLAINIPSIIGFALLLIILYGFCHRVLRLPKWTGLVAILLCCFQSSLAVFTIVPELFNSTSVLSALWQFPNYRFAGPFDGSIITIFSTLNIFVNQRHVAFVLGFFLCLLSYIQQKQRSNIPPMVFGILIGIIVPWHISIIPFIGVIGGILLIIQKQWKHSLIYSIGIVIGLLPMAAVWTPSLVRLLTSFQSVAQQVVIQSSGGGFQYIVNFFVHNLGFLLIFIVLAFLGDIKRWKILALPFAVVTVMVGWGLFYGTIDQKVFSLFLLMSKLIAVLGLYHISTYRLGWLCIIVIFPMTVGSGLFDVLVIKNDYMYPVDDYPKNSVMRYIREETSKNSIILSDQEMFDPVTLSGRRSFYGYFKQPASLWEMRFHERGILATRLFETNKKSDILNVYAAGIDYMLIPKYQRADRPFQIDTEFFRSNFLVVFEDDKYLVIKTKKIL